MTHRVTAVPRICPSCDGFASVAITVGGRDRHGYRRLITAHCKDCHGIGTPPARAISGDLVRR
jgi:hypothetical protein